MPPHEYNFWVYIMASRSLQLYIGFTNQLRVRVQQHKQLRPGSYTAQYNITRLVYYEHTQYGSTPSLEKPKSKAGSAQKS